MSARARTTDPITSHEAAAGVDLIRSQMLVLTFCREYMGEYFTDKGLVSTYRRVQPHTAYPPVSDSRLRTARKELVDAGLITFAGYTEPARGRRESIWQVKA